jgi:hypothetical protein
MQHLGPLHLHQEHGDHVGKQEERQPLEDGRELAIGHKHLQQHGDDAEGHRVEMVAAAHHQLQRLAHGGDVGRDVDGVGDDQQQHHAHQKGARRVLTQVGRHALAGDAPYARADELDGDHEGQRQKHRPEQAGAELRPRLRVGGDAGRVVIGGAGDNTWADMAQEGGDAVQHGREANTAG